MLHCNNYNRARMALAAIGLALALGAVPSGAQSGAAPWRHVDAETGKIADVASLEQLAAEFPESAAVRLRLLNALLDEGSQEAASKEALDLATRGYAFGREAETVLTEMLDPDYAAWFTAAMKRNRAPVGASTRLTAVPAEALLVESVARDPKSGDLYATTVVSRALYVLRGGAEWQRVPLEGAGSLSGIVYDAKAKLLWIASGNFDETPGEKVAAELLGYDPATGLVVRRLSGSGMGALGDVAVGEDGTVYAADPVEGTVHVARPEETVLRALVQPGTFRSPQGMAAAGRVLLVSDYRYGLAAVDTQSGQVTRIGVAQPGMMLDGIDGLWRSGRSLIAVQNGSSPMRIVRLEMSGDWLTVRRLTVLERANSAWTEPVGGAVSNGELVYVATGQWDVFGAGGAVRDGKTPRPTDIRSLRIDD